MAPMTRSRWQELVRRAMEIVFAWRAINYPWPTENMRRLVDYLVLHHDYMMELHGPGGQRDSWQYWLTVSRYESEASFHLQNVWRNPQTLARLVDRVWSLPPPYPSLRRLWGTGESLYDAMHRQQRNEVVAYMGPTDIHAQTLDNELPWHRIPGTFGYH